jgi:uncharacterized protein (TIGR04255 family)
MTTDQGRAAAQVGRIEYDHPPIVEALCQFNFATPLAWSPILPGMYYERIRAEYPTDPEVQQQVQANVQFPNDAAGAQLTVGQGDQRLIYRNKSLDRLIVLGPSQISANSLPPYEGWPNLAERFERALAKAKPIIKEAQVGAISVRYINRIFIPDLDPASSGEFFNIPHRAVGGGDVVDSLFQRVESTLSDGITQGVMTFAIVDPHEDESDGEAFLLDLEFRRALDAPMDFESAMAIASDLKAMENAEFEACITDRTRELFR